MNPNKFENGSKKIVFGQGNFGLPKSIEANKAGFHGRSLDLNIQSVCNREKESRSSRDIPVDTESDITVDCVTSPIVLTLLARGGNAFQI